MILILLLYVLLLILDTRKGHKFCLKVLSEVCLEDKLPSWKLKRDKVGREGKGTGRREQKKKKKGKKKRGEKGN